jgi:hypothetical protein
LKTSILWRERGNDFLEARITAELADDVDEQDVTNIEASRCRFCRHGRARGLSGLGQPNTINFSSELPLAHGIQLGVG